MSTPFDVRAWARQAGIQTTGGFAVVAECVTVDELQRFAEIALSQAAKRWEQPEQEPVAWMMVNKTHNLGPSLHWKPQTDWHITWEAVPLYTHPPRREWRGLTDDEIEDCWDGYLSDYQLQMIRAIEAKLKERNA